MTPMESISEFAENLRLQRKNARVETYQGGGIFLEVRMNGRLFVLCYSPSYATFCVDTINDEHSFDSGYRFGYPDFEDARLKLLALLDEERSTDN